ncbi:MAG TPA: hypothetical protein VGF75_02585 [Candidatus Saccharimonadales bacterium]|jgi:hypothetical protein
MKTDIISLRCDKTIVIVTDSSNPSSSAYASSNTVIEINGANSGSFAKGIAEMILKTQCNVCGEFSGLHRDIYTDVTQNMGGEVRGTYKRCPNSKLN